MLPQSVKLFSPSVLNGAQMLTERATLRILAISGQSGLEPARPILSSYSNFAFLQFLSIPNKKPRYGESERSERVKKASCPGGPVKAKRIRQEKRTLDAIAWSHTSGIGTERGVHFL